MIQKQENQMEVHTIKSHGAKVVRIHMHDWLILILLIVTDVVLNLIEPFHRFVGVEMMIDLKFPLRDNTIPVWTVPIIALLLPFAAILVNYFYTRNVYDLHHATLGLLYSVLLTAVITDAIKDAVGRPRPNFFWRCFPNGAALFDPLTKNVICHGDKSVINEGHKSFPSGHTSWCFAGLSFLSWYLSGKIRAFDHKGHIAKLAVVLLPLLIAALVGISRVNDYWHHWEDVFAGGLLGMTVASFCYLLCFPFPHVKDGWAPTAYFQVLAETNHEDSSSTGIPCLRLRQTGVETAYMQQPEFGRESRGTNPHGTSPILDAMENGRGGNFDLLCGLVNGLAYSK